MGCFRILVILGLCTLFGLDLWLFVVMWANSFSAAFVRFSFVFCMLVCCLLENSILDVLLMFFFIVVLKFI